MSYPASYVSFSTFHAMQCKTQTGGVQRLCQKSVAICLRATRRMILQACVNSLMLLYLLVQGLERVLHRLSV